jgi:undecaprenyl-diphosphatase
MTTVDTPTQTITSPDSPSPGRPALTVPWFAVVVVLLLATCLALISQGGNTLAIDQRTTDALQQLNGQPWRGLAQVGNTLGESTYAIPFAAILLVVSVIRRDPRDVAFLCVLLLLRGAATALKGLFDSPRPAVDVAEVLDTFDGFGFPSGHAVTSAVALGGLAFLAVRHVHSQGAAWGAALAWFAGMMMTGYARIWVGAHWLTDVIGGSLFGIAIVLIAANVSGIITRWTRERADRQVEAARMS